MVVKVWAAGRRLAVLPLALIVASGCQGEIGANGPGSVGPGTSNPGSGDATGGPVNCAAPSAPTLHAHLLTPSQYNNTVLDLVKVAGNTSKDFGGGVDTQLDDLAVELRANAAADVARQAATTLAQWTPCPSAQAADAACEALIIDRLGPQAYRHPLSTTERGDLQELFDAGVKEKDFATGLQWFLAGLFQAPDFLYQFAKPAGGEKAGDVRALPPYELASRLAYFIWDSPPDDALFTAAAGNKLGDAGAVRAQVGRMIQDQRFARGLAGFYGSWLRLGGFAEVARDDQAFSTDIVTALQTSLLMSATQLYATGGTANIAGLFGGQTYHLNGALRKFYRLPGDTTSATFTATDLPGEDRIGIVTHPGLTAMFARPAETNPIARGLFIRRTLLCKDVPPPPSGVTIPQLPPVAPNLSTRDRLDQHASDAFCASCHNMIDPPGYSLENFDQVGRHRTMDGGKPVNTAGMMLDGGDVTGAFASGGELLNKLAQSKDARGCFAQKYLEYAAAHAMTQFDQCSLHGLKKTFTPSGDLRELASAIAASDSFRMRQSEGGAP